MQALDFTYSIFDIRLRSQQSIDSITSGFAAVET
jgi:hypothetical protein